MAQRKIVPKYYFGAQVLLTRHLPNILVRSLGR